MAIRLQVVFDAADPPKLAAFWGEAIGYVQEDPPDGFDSWEAWAVANDLPREKWGNYDSRVDPDGAGPRLFFQRVPEPKTAKNRVHLDLDVSGGRETPIEDRRRRVADAVERAVAAGATRVKDYDEAGQHWVVLQDPEGNEFCLH
ncbi:MAG TPA: VOC family protein [Actinomycetota bacterium]|nr:VOC family protein [Actinomycetota bacterium]